MSWILIAGCCVGFRRAFRKIATWSILAAVVAWGTGSAEAQNRFKKPRPPAKPANEANPAGQSTGKDSAGPGVKTYPTLIPLSREAPLVLAPSPAAFALVGEDVFDLSEGAKAGCVGPLPKDRHGPKALSRDGRYFAFDNEADHVMFVEIRDSRTGRKASDFHYTEEKFGRVECLRFLTHNNLLVAGVVKDKLGVFLLKADTWQKIRELTIERVDGSHLGVSDNGRFLAVATTKSLQVYDLVQGKPIVEMAEPSSNLGHTFLFVHGLSFSPDNSELAGLISGGTFRLVIWDLQGAIKEDHDTIGLQIGGAYNEGDPISWNPNGKGWLLHGNHYFDRHLKAVVWTMDRVPSHNYHHCWLDEVHVIASQGDFEKRRLVSVPVPMEAIAAAGKAIASDEPALLRPGQQVSLDIQVGETRFAGRENVVSALSELFTKRFGEHGIKVASDQKTVLHVKYSEGAGEQLRVTKGFGPRAADTGQRVQETVTMLDLKLMAPGSRKPAWEKSIRRGNPHILRSATVNDAEVRNATFKMLEYLLSSDPIPFYISADPAGPRLPIVTPMYRLPGL
jgi:hypothetical protein